MDQSLFINYVAKYFPSITVSVVNTLNGTTRKPTYLHRRMLSKTYSVDGKWESVNGVSSLVMADVVAMDSSLPLKKRDSLGHATGDIPKMGMELKLNEKQLTDLDTLVAVNQARFVDQILQKLFADTPKVIGGIYERNEEMFLQGFSSGVCVVTDTDNVGTGVRLDFGYYAANRFGVAAVYTDATNAKPLDDFKKLQDKASLDGNSIVRFFMDLATFNNLAKTDQIRQRYAFFQNFVGGNIPVPSLVQVNGMLQTEFGYVIEIVDRAVVKEINGQRTAVKPWTAGQIVGVGSDNIGALVWATLAEQNHPVPQVSYSTVDDFILVSKYRQNKPSLSEYTSSQARVVPVIAAVDQIYTLDSLTVQA